MAQRSQESQHQSWMRPAFQWLSVLMFGLVTLQPLFGGWWLFHGGSSIDIHAMLANFIFLIAAVLVVLAFLAGFTRRMRMVGWSVALTIMVTAQIGMGYAAEGRPDVGALHIPLGVLTFGGSLMLMLFAFGFTARRDAV